MDRAREAEIQSCFNCQTEFYYPKNREAFVICWKISKSNQIFLPTTQQRPKMIPIRTLILLSKIILVESTKRDHLIVMDDVLGLAYNSQKFANFLTIARKYRYHCVYIFHTIHPQKAIWKSEQPAAARFSDFEDTGKIRRGWKSAKPKFLPGR